MGLFSKTTTKLKSYDPIHKELKWMRGGISDYLRGVAKEAPGVGEEVGMYTEPMKGRLWETMQTGQFMTPEEQQARSYMQSLMGTTAQQFMGGYDPEQQRRALTTAYTEEAPEAITRLLTSAGLGAPGIGHGRVRQEALGSAQDMYSQLQNALAAQNIQAAQLGSQAEQLAAGQRGAGAQAMFGPGGFSDIMGRQAQVQQMLQGLALAPGQAEAAAMQPIMGFNPATWGKQFYQKTSTSPGILSTAAGLMGAAGQLGMGIPGFSSLLGGFGGMGGVGGQAPSYSQIMQNPANYMLQNPYAYPNYFGLQG